jgi:hypothetical protein
MRLFCLLPLTFALLTGSAQASLDTAREAYERKDYASALAEFEMYAQRGYTEAMSMLSIMYLNGEGTPRNAQKAIQYATQAIEKGDDNGYSLLASIYRSPKSGVMDKAKGMQFLRTGADKGEQNCLVEMANNLLDGKDSPQDFAGAFSYYEKAASRHASTRAAQQLGFMYEYGLGRPIDEAKALKWYESKNTIRTRPLPSDIAGLYVSQAALKLRHPRRPADLADAVERLQLAVNAGNGEAMYRLGKLYETGTGVPQDYIAAAALYERGADSGNAAATYSGGVLFEKGLGVKQSKGEAFNWFMDAAKNMHPEAKRRFGKAYDEGETGAVNHQEAASAYCQAVYWETMSFAHPTLRLIIIDAQLERPVAQQLAILNQCGDAAGDPLLREARAVLEAQLTPAVALEVEHLSKAMKQSTITKVLARQN